MSSARLISKSAFLQGLVGAVQQAIFDQGHETGLVAKVPFPGCIEFEGACTETSRLLPRRSHQLSSAIYW